MAPAPFLAPRPVGLHPMTMQRMPGKRAEPRQNQRSSGAWHGSACPGIGPRVAQKWTNGRRAEAPPRGRCGPLRATLRPCSRRPGPIPPLQRTATRSPCATCCGWAVAPVGLRIGPGSWSWSCVGSASLGPPTSCWLRLRGWRTGLERWRRLGGWSGGEGEGEGEGDGPCGAGGRQRAPAGARSQCQCGCGPCGARPGSALREGEGEGEGEGEALLHPHLDPQPVDLPPPVRGVGPVEHDPLPVAAPHPLPMRPNDGLGALEP